MSTTPDIPRKLSAERYFPLRGRVSSEDFEAHLIHHETTKNRCFECRGAAQRSVVCNFRGALRAFPACSPQHAGLIRLRVERAE